MRFLRTLLGLVLAASLMSCASTTKLGNVAFDFPRGWHVGAEGEGLTASPDPNFGLPLLNVQVCERTDPCATPCDAKKIRADYFIFSASNGHFEYSQVPRPDGSIDFSAAGEISAETGDVQVVAHALCSGRGIVFLSLMSRVKSENLPREFQRTVETARWRQ